MLNFDLCLQAVFSSSGVLKIVGSASSFIFFKNSTLSSQIICFYPIFFDTWGRDRVEGEVLGKFRTTKAFYFRKVPGNLPTMVVKSMFMKRKAVEVALVNIWGKMETNTICSA